MPAPGGQKPVAGDGLTVERFGVAFGRGLRPFQGMTLRRIFGLLMGLAVAVASATTG